jgi:hypothetical protein
VGFFRAVAQPCYAAGLQAAGLQAPVIEERLDDLFDRTYKAACVTPRPLSWPFAAILLKRVG